MASRRDQLHSYQFLMQRVVASLVMHETDPAQAPLRRGVGAVYASAMIMVLVAAGFGVYGIFTGIGSNNWQADGSVVVEKETGASFVYLGGVLHPMLNYSSALLASGQSAPTTYRVAEKKLVGVARGNALGIPNAPDALPDASDLVGLPWTLCVAPGRDAAGQATTMSSLVVGEQPPGGHLLGEAGLLVRDPRAGAVYLIWHSHHYRFDDPTTLVPSVFGALAPVTTVGTAWLNGLPKGQDIASITVPHDRSVSTVVPGHHVGDIVYNRTGGGNQYYLVMGDGLAPITQLQMLVQVTETGPPTEVATKVVTDAPKSGQALYPSSDGTTLPPRTPPKLVSVTRDTSALCAASSSPTASPSVVVGPRLAELGPGIQTATTTSSGTSLADRVIVPPGRGEVVLALPSPTSTTGALDIVTDEGIRYPVPSAAVLATLGYSPDEAVAVPSGLVARIPEGPTLDPAAALRPAV